MSEGTITERRIVEGRRQIAWMRTWASSLTYERENLLAAADAFDDVLSALAAAEARAEYAEKGLATGDGLLVDCGRRLEAAEARAEKAREAHEQLIADLEKAAANWRESATKERTEKWVASMCGENGIPAHVISTARAISFEGAAKTARAALAAASSPGEEETDG